MLPLVHSCICQGLGCLILVVLTTKFFNFTFNLILNEMLLSSKVLMIIWSLIIGIHSLFDVSMKNLLSTCWESWRLNQSNSAWILSSEVSLACKFRIRKITHALGSSAVHEVVVHNGPPFTSCLDTSRLLTHKLLLLEKIVRVEAHPRFDSLFCVDRAFEVIYCRRIVVCSAQNLVLSHELVANRVC